MQLFGIDEFVQDYCNWLARLPTLAKRLLSTGVAPLIWHLSTVIPEENLKTDGYITRIIDSFVGGCSRPMT